jgi:DNA-binding transcriptional regulator YbjK
VVVTPRMRCLLDAGVQVVAAEGLRGLTHRAVDRQAGLPEGSCSAYLRTRLALLTALAEYVASRFATDTRALTERITAHATVGEPDSDYAVAQTVAMFVDWVEHPELLRTRLELALEGGRQPALSEVTVAWGRELVEIVEDLLRFKGLPDAEERATTLVAAMEGVLLRALREDPEDRQEFLQRSLQMLMGALVADALPS